MSVTEFDIVNQIETVKNQLKDPEVREKFKNYEAGQIKNEEILFLNNQVCGDIPGNDTLTSIRKRIANLDPDKLQEDVTQKFYNVGVMEAASCVIESIIYSPPEDVGTPYHNNLINEYIKKLKRIGAESANGYAMLGDFDGMKDFFVDKVSKDPLDDTLIHEIVVGLYGTNKLRKYIPNFSYVYGGMKCSPPLIDPETKKIVYSCLDNNNLVNYVLYENVAPAISMREYVRKCSVNDFLNAFVQTLYSLRLANKMIDYTHYDLHSENLLIRDPKLTTGGNFQIKYETENGEEYLESSFIATFIDYGYSHIKTEDIIDEKKGIIYKGQDFGVHGRIHASIFPNRSWIIYDAYRLLMDCMSEAYLNYNGKLVAETKKIFKFFNKTEDPINFIDKKVPGILPMNYKTENMQLDDLIKHIRLVCDCSFIRSLPSSLPILDCDMICPTEEQILADVGLDLKSDIVIPQDILSFNDLFNILDDQNKKDQLNYLINKFQYQNNIEIYLDDIDREVDELNYEVIKFYELDIPELSNDVMFSYDGIVKTKEIYLNIGEILNMIETINTRLDIGLSVAKIYDDEANLEYLNELTYVVDETIQMFYTQAKEFLYLYGDYLADTPKDLRKKLIDSDERLNWYWSDMVDLETRFLKLMS